MADRFPSLEDFSEGELSVLPIYGMRLRVPGQTGPASNGAHGGAQADDDFLARERALLGDDAAQFTTANDKSATVEADDDDLLGGGQSYNGAQAGAEEITDFESSFPAVDTRNDVRLEPTLFRIPRTSH